MPAPDDKRSARETAEPADGAGQRAEAREDGEDAAAARRAAIEAILALRDSAAIPPVTREEILAWHHEGQK